MAKVKGYYNTNNGVFLGPMTATNEATGVASTPRYIEGVCFGEFDTDTQEFVPHTNPMHIPKGMIYTQDEQITADGKLVNMRTGIEEEVGADFVAKRIIAGTAATRRTPNVVTKDEGGKVYPDRPAIVIERPSNKKTEPAPVQSPVKPIQQAEQVTHFEKADLPTIDLDNLF